MIRPEGLLTEYEFRLEGPRETYFCESRVPCAPVTLIGSGHIEAGVGEEKVDADAAGLEGVRYYTWWLTARNFDGVAESRGSVFETNLPLPVNKINVYEPGNASGAEWGQHASELRVAEYQAAQKVKAEQEQAARETAERAAQAALPSAATKCVVPSLSGHTLAGARWLLARAHCKLGRVSYLRRRSATVHIATQNPARGTHLVAAASVSVRLTR